jgi:hypothetical protein
MVLGRPMARRIVIAGLAATLAAPVAVIQPAAAAILFTCDSVTGSGTVSPGVVHDKRAQSLSSGPTAPAGPADITLVSTWGAGVNATWMPSLSADGTRVAFYSTATNLDPADPENDYDVYVKSLITGDVVLASTSDTGVKGDIGSYSPTLSADGTRVAFFSRATNFDPGDTDGLRDAYVKDLTTGDIVLASSSDTGVKANGRVLGGTMSADGTRVMFDSTATNLDAADADTLFDVYVKNLNNGNVDLVSRSATGVKGNGHSVAGRTTSQVQPSSETEGTLSADGRKVAFISNATNLDPADTDNLRDVYVKDRHTGEITVASISDTGVKANALNGDAVLSGDGTAVAFWSEATNLDPADTDDVHDVYVKNLTTGDIVLASTSDAGVKGDDDSSVQALSADGTKVVISSKADNLDPAIDPNKSHAGADVYVKNLITGDLTMVSTSDTGVGSNGIGDHGSPTADFTKVAFDAYATNLDAADPDFNPDIYLKQLPTVPTSIAIDACSNGNSGTASVIDIRSYGSRPLGCPTSLGGAAGNDYADTTPILVGGTLSMTIDWATGPDSYGVAAAKAGPAGTQWRFRLAISPSPGHETPATNQYLPAAGSGATKTRLQGKLDISALDTFNCTSGVDDPLSWVDLANNGSWVAKSA